MNNEIEKLKEEIAMLKEEVRHLKVMGGIAYVFFKKAMSLVPVSSASRESIDKRTKELDDIYSKCL